MSSMKISDVLGPVPIGSQNYVCC